MTESNNQSKNLVEFAGAVSQLEQKISEAGNAYTEVILRKDGKEIASKFLVFDTDDGENPFSNVEPESVVWLKGELIADGVEVTEHEVISVPEPELSGELTPIESFNALKNDFMVFKEKTESEIVALKNDYESLAEREVETAPVEEVIAEVFEEPVKVDEPEELVEDLPEEVVDSKPSKKPKGKMDKAANKPKKASSKKTDNNKASGDSSLEDLAQELTGTFGDAPVPNDLKKIIDDEEAEAEPDEDFSNEAKNKFASMIEEIDAATPVKVEDPNPMVPVDEEPVFSDDPDGEE